MLKGIRPILPTDIKNQVEWDKLKGVIVLGLKSSGEKNSLQMSSLTFEEMSFLSKQLDAHLTCLLGTMDSE